MTALNLDRIPAKATGLKLYKIKNADTPREELLANELVVFEEGASAINTILRRASLSGLVEVDPDGPLPDYYADVYEGPSGDDGWNISVALDAESYKSLKYHWMRTVYERFEL